MATHLRRVELTDADHRLLGAHAQRLTFKHVGPGGDDGDVEALHLSELIEHDARHDGTSGIARAQRDDVERAHRYFFFLSHIRLTQPAIGGR